MGDKRAKNTPLLRKRLNTLANIFGILGVLFLLLSFAPVIKSEIWYRIKEKRNQQYILDAASENSGPQNVFGKLMQERIVKFSPVNTEFSLIIEKIGVNAPIVPDVTVRDKKAYKAALKDGIAHAGFSDYPSEEPGNVYLFAHSALNFWELGQYAETFNLLRKLGKGDLIHVFYDGQLYEYKVVDSRVYKGWDTYPITRPSIEPLLTLQTCDPPGTVLNRLVVTARLLEVREF